MIEGPIRRAQAIAPFGVGAVITVPGGISLMSAGLDYWFDREPGDRLPPIDESEFVVREWRLGTIAGGGVVQTSAGFSCGDGGSWGTGETEHVHPTSVHSLPRVARLRSVSAADAAITDVANDVGIVSKLRREITTLTHGADVVPSDVPSRPCT